MKKYILPLLLFISIASCKNDNSNDRQNDTETELLAMAMQDDKYGYINTKGEFVIEAKYELARTFSNGVACVNIGGKRDNYLTGAVVGGKYVFINTKGEIQFDNLSSSNAMSFYNNVAIIENDDKTYNLLNSDGKIVAKNFTTLGDCENDLIPAVLDKKIGYLNPKGDWAIELPYKYFIGPYSEGLSYFSDVEKKLRGYFNTKGEIVIRAQFTAANNFKEGIARVKKPKDNGYTFINPKGEAAFDGEYIIAGDFSEGLCAVNNGGQWGFIDKSGKLAIPFQTLEGVRDFNEGLCAVKKEGKVGYLNKKGEMIIEPQFINGLSFKNGYAIISTENNVGFINKKGEIVIEPKFKRVGNFVAPNKSNLIFKEN